MPPIPESRLDWVTVDEAVFMWVRQGRLTVRTEDAVLVAETGQAVWIAPQVRHSAVVAAGSVALPIFLEAALLPLIESCVVTVPPGWEDWLAYRMAKPLGVAMGMRPDRSRLLDLLAHPGTERDWTAPRLPPLPRSAGARRVVQGLLENPASSSTAAELAATALTSARTLQRQLKDETGFSLGQWRTAVRVDAAAAYLTQGRDIGWTAHQVGYASASGFAHAFAGRMGMSPGRYAAMRGAWSKEELLLTALVQSTESRVEPPQVPTMTSDTWTMTGQGELFEHFLWVYRGWIVVEISGTSWRLEAGDVLLPRPGVSHRFSFAEGAIALPLGYRLAARPAPAGAPTVLRMPADAELFLLHQVVANHFWLRPPGHHDEAFFELPQVSSVGPETLPEAVETVVSAVVRDPADRRTLTEWAVSLGIEHTLLRREFTRALGEPFTRWRTNVRMNEARHLMWAGHPPSVVARRLGYQHLPAFTKAFTAAHGMPPREWLRLGTD